MPPVPFYLPLFIKDQIVGVFGSDYDIDEYE